MIGLDYKLINSSKVNIFKTSQAIVTTPVGADGKSRDLAILLANRFSDYFLQTGFLAFRSIF